MIVVYLSLCWQHGSEYHYNLVKTIFLKCYFTPSRIFHITKEFEDKQKPVLVSAHPPPKNRQKISFVETLIPQPPKLLHSLPGWHIKDICHMHLLKEKFIF